MTRRPFTLTGFARETGWSIRQVRKAVDLGEIRFIIFGGRKLIPASETDRIKDLPPTVIPMRPYKKTAAGWSPLAAAARCEVPWTRFRKAMEKGQVQVVDFGDQVRITNQEIARIRGLYGLSPTPENPDETPVTPPPMTAKTDDDYESPFPWGMHGNRFNIERAE